MKEIITTNKLPSEIIDELVHETNIYRKKFGELYTTGQVKTSSWAAIQQSWWFPYLKNQLIVCIVWSIVFRIWLYKEWLSSGKSLITYLINSNWTPYLFTGTFLLMNFITFFKNQNK
jgi:hypothetical protein